MKRLIPTLSAGLLIGLAVMVQVPQATHDLFESAAARVVMPPMP